MQINGEICKERKTDIKCKDCNGCKTYKNINFICMLIELKIDIQKHNPSFHSGENITVLSHDLECNWQDCIRKQAIKKVSENNHGKIGNVFVESCPNSVKCYGIYYKKNPQFHK